MVKYTNTEISMGVEASSTRRKRQRLSSLEEEEEEVGEKNGGVNVNGDGVMISEIRSGTLFKLDLLDCPVCSKPLTIPIFQCDNGHVACSSCCYELRYKCSSCTAPIGSNRSRIMERFVEAVIVPCPNAKHGCTEKFSYGNELVHENECSFALCYCPAPNCNYSGVYKDLYNHYGANHKKALQVFECGRSEFLWLDMAKKILVLQEDKDGPLVVVQCFQVTHGLCLTVNCIAPSTPGVGDFSFHISSSFEDATHEFTKGKMNKIQKLSFLTPTKNFAIVPYDSIGHFKTNICINRLKEAEDEEEDDEAEEEEDDKGEEEEKEEEEDEEAEGEEKEGEEEDEEDDKDDEDEEDDEEDDEDED